MKIELKPCEKCGAEPLTKHADGCENFVGVITLHNIRRAEMKCQTQFWNTEKNEPEQCGMRASWFMTWNESPKMTGFICLCDDCRSFQGMTPPENAAEREILSTIRFTRITEAN